MTKAMREAKVNSSWTSPSDAYESAAHRFIDAVLASQPFLDDFQRLHRRVSRVGFLNSLSQTLLRLTAPGAPDTYQGTELLDFSLVDPDNRRPVDYQRRREMLAALGESTGDLNLWMSKVALRCRRDQSC